VAQTIFLPASGPATRCSVQWWELTAGGINPNETVSGGTVIQRGLIDDPISGRFFAYPSIAVNRRFDVLVGYSRFGASQFPGANYAFRIDADIFSTLRDDTVLKSGQAPFFVDGGGINRWGNWSATTVDPNNDTDLWTVQQYAAAPFSGSDRWGTWWGRVSPPADLSVTLTGAPNAVLAGSNVTYSITITNHNHQFATGVRLMDALPAGASLVSATPSQGACSLTNGIVTCDFGTVGDTGRVTAVLVVRLDTAGLATNAVTVSSYGPEQTPANNIATTTLRVLARPVITSLRIVAEGAEISFTTEAGLNYTVELKDDLSAPAWSMRPTMIGSGGVMTVIDPNVVTQRFYRIRVE